MKQMEFELDENYSVDILKFMAIRADSWQVVLSTSGMSVMPMIGPQYADKKMGWPFPAALSGNKSARAILLRFVPWSDYKLLRSP